MLLPDLGLALIVEGSKPPLDLWLSILDLTTDGGLVQVVAEVCCSSFALWAPSLRVCSYFGSMYSFSVYFLRKPAVGFADWTRLGNLTTPATSDVS